MVHPVHSTSNGISATTTTVAFDERDVLKLILEFLENHRFHIAQLSLERETGIINGRYTDNMLFLRQLIIDGQWDGAITFAEPLKDLAGFHEQKYRFLINKYKYFELLCIKQEPGTLADFAVEEFVECLKELEKLCDQGEEFRQLCSLLTLPNPKEDHEHFANWNPSSARVECFQAIYPLVVNFIDALNPSDKEKKPDTINHMHAEGDRLLQLLVKGIFYEYAVDYCQSQGLEGKNALKPKFQFTNLFNHQMKLASVDLSLISWLEVLGNEQFTVPFQQKTLEFRLNSLQKPRLEAQWIEQILETPIKPCGQFPHSYVPFANLKSVQQHLMSQSMSASMAYATAQRQYCATPEQSLQHMSHSTFPSLAVFSIQQENKNVDNTDNKNTNLLGEEDVMRQSEIISDMLFESSNTSTCPSALTATVSHHHSSFSTESNEREPVENFESSNSFQPEVAINMDNDVINRQLENVNRRNKLKLLPFVDKKTAVGKIKQTMVLQPVPELGTPYTHSPQPIFDAVQQQHQKQEKSFVSDEIVPPEMIQSRLFQEFILSKQMQQQILTTQQLNYLRSKGTMFLPFQQQYGIQNCDFPIQQSQFFMPTLYGHAGVDQSYTQQPTSVAMRLKQQQSQMNDDVPYLQNNNTQQRYATTWPMLSRPTSLIMAPDQLQCTQLHSQSMMSQNYQPPGSYLDKYELPIDTNQREIAIKSHSMIAKMPIEQQQSLRRESFSEEILNNIKPTPLENQFEKKQNENRINSSALIRFIPICRYQDSQAIRTVAFHPSGGHFVIGTNSRKLLICSYPRLKMKIHNHTIDRINSNSTTAPEPQVLLTRPKQHKGSVYCAVFDQSGKLLATGSNDKTIRLMNVQIDNNNCCIGTEVELQHVHDGTVRDLIFMDERLSLGSSPSSVIVSGGAGNCQICVTDCTTGRTFKKFDAHTGPILGLFNWGSSKNFVSCSQDKTIRFWDLRASNATSVIWPTTKTSNSPVTSVCVDPNGKLLVSGHEDASIMLYDICGGRVVQLFRPHSDQVRAIRLSNAAYYLLSGSYDKRILISDMRGNLVEPLAYMPVAEHSDKVTNCRWHPSKFSFLSTSADKSAILWSLPLPPSMD